MKKLTEYKDREALNLLADLLVPLSEILTDKPVVKKFKENKLTGISAMIKGHTDAVINIMATLEGIPVNEYHCDLLTLPKTILEILNDKDLGSFFGSQLETVSSDASGEPTKPTRAKRK